jgi:uncharacterized protein YjbI with pentapeptide repeats
MLLLSAEFDTHNQPARGWEDGVTRYCEFEGLHFDGRGPEGLIADCMFSGCSWYWSLFNMAILIGVSFKNCEFSGVSFAGCRFIECSFEGCRFTVDSFGKPCSFSDNRWYACEFLDTFVPEGLDGKVARA